MVPYYMDNCGNTRANTCIKTPTHEGVYLLDKKPIEETRLLVNHDNFTNRMTSVDDGSFKFLPYQVSIVV